MQSWLGGYIGQLVNGEKKEKKKKWGDGSKEDKLTFKKWEDVIGVWLVKFFFFSFFMKIVTSHVLILILT